MPKHIDLGRFTILFDVGRWKFHLTILQLVKPPVKEQAILRLKRKPVYVATNVYLHLAFGYGLFADMFAKGYYLSFALNKKNIKEGEMFGGFNWRKVTKHMLHHPNHSGA